MSNPKEQTFASVLAALFSDDEPPIHLLYRLSDMSEVDFERFKNEWRAVGEDRRTILTRHMADLSEENYLLDFSPVFAHLFKDVTPGVRVAALDGVWDSEDITLIQPIMDLLSNDPNDEVRAAAARALAHYILLAEWGQIDDSHTPAIVNALLAEYQSPSSSIELKRAALEAVSPANHPRIAEIIEEAYEGGNEDLQLSAIFAMGNTADERWLPILEYELNSMSPDFRAEAARACGMIGEQQSIEPLEQLLSDDELEVGIAAVYALGMIGGEQAYDILSRLAEDPDYEDYYDAIDEALEEMEWIDSGLDILAFTDMEDDDEDGDLLDELRLN